MLADFIKFLLDDLLFILFKLNLFKRNIHLFYLKLVIIALAGKS